MSDLYKINSFQLKQRNQLPHGAYNTVEWKMQHNLERNIQILGITHRSCHFGLKIVIEILLVCTLIT